MTSKNHPTLHPTTQYAMDVVDGKVIACKWVILACQRHLDDLNRDDIRFSKKRADWAIKFLETLKQSKGRWGGMPLKLQPWQKFIVGSIFGWIKKDGTRRYRTAYVEVPRKNGKSTLASGIALLLLLADREFGADVFCAATKIDQAKLVFSDCKRLVKGTGWKEIVKTHVNEILYADTGSKIAPLSADADKLDGLNPHGIICDELHAWPGMMLWDVLQSARGARAQPVTLAITTAGVNQLGICWEQRQQIEAILSGKSENLDDYFGYIATIDEGDSWDDPKCWAKANPNLGTSISQTFLESECASAKQSTARTNAFKRYYLNIWLSSEMGWIDLGKWDECGAPFDESELLGERCFGGLDLAKTSDIASFVLTFPVENGFFKWIPFFWMAENPVSKRESDLMDQLRPLIQRGYIKLCKGQVVDFKTIEYDILAIRKKYDLEVICFDPWQGEHMRQILEGHGIQMLEFLQTMRNYTEPCNFLEALVTEKKLMHGGNPVMRWMLGNVTVETNGEYIKPSKKKSKNKIDGIVSGLMSIGGAIQMGENGGCPIIT